jgi:hypothetical protein
MKKPMSKTERLMRALAKKAMTVPQIRARFPDIPNPSAVLYDIKRLKFRLKKRQTASGYTSYGL